jgi:uncharacterized protein
VSDAPAAFMPNVEDPVSGRFWREAAAGRLSFQVCAACGYTRWPPAPVCPECLSGGGEWKPVAGGGSVWSFAVYERAYHPDFADKIPYVVALIELDAGPRLISNLVAIEPERVHCGLRVCAVFEPAGPEAALVKFTPEKGEIDE